MTHSQSNDDLLMELSQKELLIKEMMINISQIQRRFQSDDNDEERQWMISGTNNPEVKAFLEESTVVMLHVIDAIGQLEPVNGITISKQFGIPRGSVSKVTRKLKELNIIQSESLPDNKKEVLFRITPLGQEIFDLHQALHHQMGINIRKFMQRYDISQLQFLLQSMRDTLVTSWVEPESVIGAGPDEPSGHGVQYTPSMESVEINEILTLLQQLDARNLQKVKEMVKVVFFD